jgi:hypothetical protein
MANIIRHRRLGTINSSLDLDRDDRFQGLNPVWIGGDNDRSQARNAGFGNWLALKITVHTTSTGIIPILVGRSDPMLYLCCGKDNYEQEQNLYRQLPDLESKLKALHASSSIPVFESIEVRLSTAG